MQWNDETRLSVINGRLSRLEFLTYCLPFLVIFDWLATQQLLNHKVPAFLFGKIIGILLMVFCILARGRWRDYGYKVDTPMYFCVVNYIIFLLFIVQCTFYNISLILMLAFIITSACLPAEECENDYGLVPMPSLIGQILSFVCSIASIIFILKILKSTFAIRMNC